MIHVIRGAEEQLQVRLIQSRPRSPENSRLRDVGDKRAALEHQIPQKICKRFSVGHADRLRAEIAYRHHRMVLQILAHAGNIVDMRGFRHDGSRRRARFQRAKAIGAS